VYELENVWYRLAGSRKEERKKIEARERINNKLDSHMTSSPGIEPEITVVN
jgi:hypothetical protein